MSKPTLIIPINDKAALEIMDMANEAGIPYGMGASGLKIDASNP